MAGPHPPYGFQYNDARDNHVVDPEKMTAIERIFRMVGAEGHTMNATTLVFNCEGVRPPFGGRAGHRSTYARPLRTTCTAPTPMRKWRRWSQKKWPLGSTRRRSVMVSGGSIDAPT